MCESNVTIQVWPSGGDLATTEAPTTPVPPGLLSTMMFQPVVSIRLAWMIRATGGERHHDLEWAFGPVGLSADDGGRHKRSGAAARDQRAAMKNGHERLP